MSELYHHGIKGQKWGIRRFQNPDGTLTEEGKRRYGDTREGRSKMYADAYAEVKGEYDKTQTRMDERVKKAKIAGGVAGAGLGFGVGAGFNPAVIALIGGMGAISTSALAIAQFADSKKCEEMKALMSDLQNRSMTELQNEVGQYLTDEEMKKLFQG